MCWMLESIASPEMLCSPRAISNERTRQKDFSCFHIRIRESVLKFLSSVRLICA